MMRSTTLSPRATFPRAVSSSTAESSSSNTSALNSHQDKIGGQHWEQRQCCYTEKSSGLLSKSFTGNGWLGKLGNKLSNCEMNKQAHHLFRANSLLFDSFNSVTQRMVLVGLHKRRFLWQSSHWSYFFPRELKDTFPLAWCLSKLL